MRTRILWRLIIGFVLGVGFRSLLVLSWPFATLVGVLSVLAVLFSYLDNRKRAAYLTLAVALAACAAGFLRIDIAAREGNPVLAAYIDKKVVLLGSVLNDPDIREKSVRLHVRITSLETGTTTRKASGDVLVIAPLYSGIAYGDMIRAEGELRQPQAFETSDGRMFDYPLFLAKDGILYELAFAQVVKTGEGRTNPLKALAIGFKHWYLSGLRVALPEPSAGLAAGITVGEKRGSGEELNEVFRIVGLTHIIVLSGYNITIILNALAYGLAQFSRPLRFTVSALAVFFVVLMAGAAASAVRAGIMALIAVYARQSRRVFLSLRVLAVAAFAMILWNPYTLVFDPGFQLSVLATFGLVAFGPFFARKLTRIPEKFGLREIASSTLATQLTVLPLILYQSGQLSVYALPANLFALAAIPSAMALSAIAALAGVLLGPVSAVFALPAHMLLSYIIGVANIFASLPLASLSLPVFPSWLLCIAYACIGIGYAYIEKEKRPRAMLSAAERMNER